MQKRLSGKSLLIMGANPETTPLVLAAKAMGLHVYVTDNNPVAPAKALADEQLNIDGLDVHRIAEFVTENAIDGVLVGVADRLIDPYRQVCELTDRPCYATELQCKVLTNKSVFNEWATNLGICTIPNFEYDEIASKALANELATPILVKPADSNSGKGMCVARTLDELVAARQNALAASASNRVLLERYMECDDALLFYTFENGRCHLSAMADRYTNRNQGTFAPVCIGAKYPSKHLELYLDKHHSKFECLFRKLQMHNGVLLVSAFIENDELYVYDPGFRLQGEGANHHLNHINGIDQYGMLITNAVSGETNSNWLAGNDPLLGGRYAATIWTLLKTGKIRRVEGMQSLLNHPNVHHVTQRLHVGDMVTEQMLGTEAQVFARIFLSASDDDELEAAITCLTGLLSVRDNTDNEMILTNPLSSSMNTSRHRRICDENATDAP